MKMIIYVFKSTYISEKCVCIDLEIDLYMCVYTTNGYVFIFM